MKRPPSLEELPPPPPGRNGWPWTDSPAPPVADRDDGPRVAIVTPSFNQCGYLEEAIRSVLLQGVWGLRYTIIDGGSSDASLEVIRRYEPWLDSWVSEPDRGQADAINKGFEQTPGEFLGWLNSDDVLYPGFLTRRIRQFESAPEIDLIYGDVDVGPSLGSELRPLRGRGTSLREMVRTLHVPVPQQSALWRRSLFERVGGLDPRWQVVLDRDFFLRAARAGCISYRPGSSGLFRSHPGAKSTAMERRWTVELPELYERFFADRTLTDDIRNLRRESMMNVHFRCAVIEARSSRYVRCTSSLLRSFGWHPTRFLAEHVFGAIRRRAGRRTTEL